MTKRRNDDDDYNRSSSKRPSIQTDMDLQMKSHKRNAAIGIFTHGVINPRVSVEIPSGVTIQKQNVAAPGCVTYADIYRRKDHKVCYQITRKALSNIKSCIDKKQYLKSAKKYNSQKGNPFKGLHTPENVCLFFDKSNTKPYKQKEYSLDMDLQNIIFVVENTPENFEINLIACDITQLIAFFTSDGKTLTPEDEQELRKFIEERGYPDYPSRSKYLQREVTTTQIFKLIEIARDYLNVENVNIFDNSCNVIFSSSDDPPVTTQIHEDYVNPLNNEEIEKLGKFGGKTRKLRKKRRRTKTKRN